MKIGYYATYIPYKKNPEKYVSRFSGGGMEVAALQLALHMGRRGHEVVVFTTSLDSNHSIEEYENVKICRYKPNFTIASAPFSLRMFEKPLKYELDIIHAHLAAPTAALAGLWHAKKRNIPFIVGYHGDLQANFGSPIRRMSTFFYNTFLHNRLLSHAVVIFSPAECYIKNSMFLGKYKEKVIAIPHGIILDDFQIPYSKVECRRILNLPISDNIISFVGWLSPRKGPDILVRAIPHIIKNVPNIKVIFIGTDLFDGKMERLAYGLGIGDHVKFVGYVNDDLKKLFYHSSDVFVLPSTMTTESFGIVNLEAMACGLPIVASDIGGIPEIVKNGQNGFLVTPRDPKSLAVAIIKLLEDETLRTRMSQDGRKKVQNYSWPKIAEETEKVYLKVLNS